LTPAVGKTGLSQPSSISSSRSSRRAAHSVRSTGRHEENRPARDTVGGHHNGGQPGRWRVFCVVLTYFSIPSRLTGSLAAARIVRMPEDNPYKSPRAIEESHLGPLRAAIRLVCFSVAGLCAVASVDLWISQMKMGAFSCNCLAVASLCAARFIRKPRWEWLLFAVVLVGTSAIILYLTE